MLHSSSPAGRSPSWRAYVLGVFPGLVFVEQRDHLAQHQPSGILVTVWVIEISPMPFFSSLRRWNSNRNESRKKREKEWTRISVERTSSAVRARSSAGTGDADRRSPRRRARHIRRQHRIRAACTRPRAADAGPGSTNLLGLPRGRYAEGRGPHGSSCPDHRCGAGSIERMNSPRWTPNISNSASVMEMLSGRLVVRRKSS